MSNKMYCLAPVLAGVCAVFAAPIAQASSSYGTLSNFDVYNDSTSTSYHGFEIEFEHFSPSQFYSYGGVPYTFNNLHFGAGKVSSDGVNTIVRYFKGTPGDVSTQWSVQPWNGVIFATGGHACVSISGCEHFGTVLTAAPSATHYYWLDANGNRDTANPVNLLAPIVTIAPPPPPAPAQPPQPAVVQAVVAAPPPPPAAPVQYEFGDAVWVKVFKTEVNHENKSRLEDLMADKPEKIADAGDGVPEVEWKLIQHYNDINGDHDAAKAAKGVADSGEQEVGAGNEQVLRTYQFFKFTGKYNDEDGSHEAWCSDIGTCEDDVASGNADAARNIELYVGKMIGQQMVAADLNLGANAVVPVPPAVWLFGSALVGLGVVGKRRPAATTESS
ncbi:VPLPA-CTERM sorting domain-containing protein [Methylococcus sp. EFPC2]|uniref:VPLPA-CTERM sorting domain-containing protein n=1 Tax=Methylococcus sp. EFPC2 TaxID=2812648 RepID=UPI00196824E2|nr:VPLPA-CTERM sorting domain-containing protein [Methylococcus sp. EFPC2]QSA97307.1 VPLPA-CTERM sorting domain-containing protein [Methylococcus sp. EFPC2]